MNSRRYLRRSIVSSIVMRLLVLAAVWVGLQLADPTASEPRVDDPVQTVTPELGIVTDEFEQTIEVQGGKTLGREIQVTCPDRMELRKDEQMTCLVTEATDTVAPTGTPIADALVTITDPGAAKGAVWKWTSVTPSVSTLTPEPLTAPGG